MPIRWAVSAASVVGLLVPGAAAIAQSASGNIHVDARCGTPIDVPPVYGSGGSLQRHGECPANPGLASSNDAAASWQTGPTLFIADAHSHVDFFGTSADAGAGSAAVNMIVQSSDLFFTNIANPAQTGIINVGGAHFLVGGIATTEGLSNCSPFRPYARAVYDMAMGPCHATGDRTLEPDFGVQTSGAFVGYANDGSLVDAFAPGSIVNLAFGNTCFLQLLADAEVLYCDHPPAAVGDARARVVWRLPCGRPIFDLPAGYTADCPSLRIVRNRSHALDCCPADLDDGSGTGTPDGGVDINDLLYFLAQYEAGAVAVDLDDGSGTWTPDGGVDINDLLFFLAHYEGGC